MTDRRGDRFFVGCFLSFVLRSVIPPSWKNKKQSLRKTQSDDAWNGFFRIFSKLSLWLEEQTCCAVSLPSLKPTSPLKINVWKMRFIEISFWDRPFFMGYLSFRECRLRACIPQAGRYEAQQLSTHDKAWSCDSCAVSTDEFLQP